MDSVLERFNKITWHDSKLLGLSFYRTGSGEEIRISLRLRGEGTDLSPTDIVFKESTYITMEVDLEDKRVCGDDISGGECYQSSDWIKSLSERNSYDNFGGYLHFEIYLIPPGGKIRVLAKDFVLEPIA